VYLEVHVSEGWGRRIVRSRHNYIWGGGGREKTFWRRLTAASLFACQLLPAASTTSPPCSNRGVCRRRRWVWVCWDHNACPSEQLGWGTLHSASPCHPVCVLNIYDQTSVHGVQLGTSQSGINYCQPSGIKSVGVRPKWCSSFDRLHCSRTCNCSAVVMSSTMRSARAPLWVTRMMFLYPCWKGVWINWRQTNLVDNKIICCVICSHVLFNFLHVLSNYLFNTCMVYIERDMFANF